MLSILKGSQFIFQNEQIKRSILKKKIIPTVYDLETNWFTFHGVCSSQPLPFSSPQTFKESRGYILSLSLCYSITLPFFSLWLFVVWLHHLQLLFGKRKWRGHPA